MSRKIIDITEVEVAEKSFEKRRRAKTTTKMLHDDCQKKEGLCVVYTNGSGERERERREVI